MHIHEPNRWDAAIRRCLEVAKNEIHGKAGVLCTCDTVVICYHSGGVGQGEKQTAHQCMVAGNDFDTVKGLHTE